jgi:sRNA-binding protein
LEKVTGIKMSVNDEIKIMWKTACKWRDTEDFAKRKNIRPRNTNSKESFDTVPLKGGDAVKIRFGRKWYDAEVLESWSPVSKTNEILQLEGMFRKCVQIVYHRRSNGRLPDGLYHFQC